MWWPLLWYVVCVVLILCLAYWVTQKRAGMMGGSFNFRDKKLRMELLSQMVVGKNERLLIVETVGRYFLLGSTSGGITVLAEFSEEEINAWRACEFPSTEEKQSFFSGILEKELKKKQR